MGGHRGRGKGVGGHRRRGKGVGGHTVLKHTYTVTSYTHLSPIQLYYVTYIYILDMRMPRAECIITIIHITGQPAVFCSYPAAWSADAVLLSAGFWPAELVLSPELVS